MLMSRYLHIAPASVLFERARAVERFDDSLRELVAEMYSLMYSEYGVGLAAPQAGDLLRVAVIDLRGRAMRRSPDATLVKNSLGEDSLGEDSLGEDSLSNASLSKDSFGENFLGEDFLGEDIFEPAEEETALDAELLTDDCREAQEPFALINPEITWRGEELRVHEEGCLSFPDILVCVERPREVEVSYYDLAGRRHYVRAHGLLSICLQHELDHLDGRTIIDSLSRLRRSMVLRRFAKQARLSGLERR